jgi:16S rRNA (guanine527-N7)-methyltransferase
MSFVSDLEAALNKTQTGLSPKQLSAVLQFAKILYEENEIQNLTRIEGAQEFIDGHLIDVLELMKLDWLGERVADIGSGSGVPGLLAAAIDTNAERSWHLIESETHKAQYLLKSADEMGLTHQKKRVFVYGERAETAVLQAKPSTITARAVGPVDKIAAWSWNCSTWNNLVLFKSRGWKEEWERAQLTKFGKKLTVTQTHEYSVGEKYRVIVNLTRSKNG